MSTNLQAYLDLASRAKLPSNLVRDVKMSLSFASIPCGAHMGLESNHHIQNPYVPSPIDDQKDGYLLPRGDTNIHAKRDSFTRILQARNYTISYCEADRGRVTVDQGGCHVACSRVS